jgi:hypothetical protein
MMSDSISMWGPAYLCKPLDMYQKVLIKIKRESLACATYSLKPLHFDRGSWRNHTFACENGEMRCYCTSNSASLFQDLSKISRVGRQQYSSPRSFSTRRWLGFSSVWRSPASELCLLCFNCVSLSRRMPE